MGLTNEQEKAREEDANVRYLSQNICNKDGDKDFVFISYKSCLLYTSPSPRDRQKSRMPSSA